MAFSARRVAAAKGAGRRRHVVDSEDLSSPGGILCAHRPQSAPIGRWLALDRVLKYAFSQDGSMTLKERIEIIRAIEDRLDVTALTYKGLYAWPHIRHVFSRQLRHPGKYKMEPVGNLTRYARQVCEQFYKPDSFVPFLTHAQQRYNHLARLIQHGPVDLLFFSRVENYVDRFEGQYYNRFLDPMIEWIQGQYTWIKVELSADRTEATLPRKVPTTLLDNELYVRWGANRSVMRAFQHDGAGPGIAGAEALLKALAPYRTALSFDAGQCAIDLEKFIHLREYFKDLLGVLRPRVVFVVCYYSLWGTALCMACRQLGIPAVDVQHGQHSRYHAMYCHWASIPDRGYEMLPDYFWTWGRETVDNMMQTRADPLTRHIPVVGGNRWLAKWLEPDEQSPALDPQAHRYFDRLGSYEKIVLVTLQPIDEPMPEHLIEAMKAAPRSWFWMIRLHPKQSGQVRAFSENVVKITPCAEVSECTRLPLYALLQKADHHVTRTSSTCYEALYFGLQTTLIDEDGLGAYRSYVEQGHFNYAGDADTLITSITESKRSTAAKETRRYIETGREFAQHALDVILAPQRSDAESIAV